MLRGLGTLVLLALLVVATIGMAGQGPLWVRYVGSGTMFFLLMLILTQLSNLPNKEEYQKMFSGEAGGEEIFSAEPIPGAMSPSDEDSIGRN